MRKLKLSALCGAVLLSALATDAQAGIFGHRHRRQCCPPPPYCGSVAAPTSGTPMTIVDEVNQLRAEVDVLRIQVDGLLRAQNAPPVQ
jgi:hypothetical protein